MRQPIRVTNMLEGGSGLNDRVTGTSFSICQEILCKHPPSFLPPPPSLFFFLLPHKSFHKKNENRRLGGGLARTGFASNSRDLRRARGGPEGGKNPKRQKNGVDLIELEFYFPSIVLCMGVLQAMHAFF